MRDAQWSAGRLGSEDQAAGIRQRASGSGQRRGEWQRASHRRLQVTVAGVENVAEGWRELEKLSGNQSNTIIGLFPQR